MEAIIILFILAIGPLAMLLGADSRDNINSLEPQRVQSWFGSRN